MDKILEIFIELDYFSNNYIGDFVKFFGIL